MNDIEWLTHSKVRLALHHLRPASSSADAGPDSSPRRSLLLLHGLGESSATQPPAWAEQWTGSVAALDFTGHGLSTLPNGG
ncbi:MAG: hypothetical protein ABIQ39_00575, partial [Ilumatobacteraceae bacterium]